MGILRMGKKDLFFAKMKLAQTLNTGSLPSFRNFHAFLYCITEEMNPGWFGSYKSNNVLRGWERILKVLELKIKTYKRLECILL